MGEGEDEIRAKTRSLELSGQVSRRPSARQKEPETSQSFMGERQQGHCTPEKGHEW